MLKLKSAKYQVQNVFGFFAVLGLFCACVFAQEGPPAPAAPRARKIPAVVEKKLPNGLTIAVVERQNVPLVTVQLLVKSGAASESITRAGLADLTASMLTKGTKTRTATQIAEQIEFLGASINTGAGWNNSVVNLTVMADKLDQALEIMADVVMNPKFDQKEIDLLKSQTLDGLTYNLSQPGFLANYVASKYSFNEHPAGGTPASINAIGREDITAFHQGNYIPKDSVLIFTGDISAVKATAAAQKFFGKWQMPPAPKAVGPGLPEPSPKNEAAKETVRRILVVDLPNSGQASVNYFRSVTNGRVKCSEPGKCQVDQDYYPASVLNSVLGGGYSSRLNQEIRIKRGLSYGAGSSFAWRGWKTNFGTRTQTKNESAAEVTELILAEIQKLTDANVSNEELNPRKQVLTGGFGRNLETTQGLAAALGELYSFGLPAAELNSYVQNVQTVTEAQIRSFAAGNLKGGDIIIVGDYGIFKDDLAKRFPDLKIEFIKAGELDLNKENLRK